MHDNADRRVTRTQKALERALAELIDEKGYDAITIQDITDRANVGRTTFYLHYRGKDDLFIRAHAAGMVEFRFGIFSKAELLSDEPPATLIAVCEYMKGNRSLLDIMKHGKDSTIILRAIQNVIAENLEASLREAFSESESRVPFSWLANYIAGAQMNFMGWWIERRISGTAEAMARTIHRLQRAAVRDALEMTT